MTNRSKFLMLSMSLLTISCGSDGPSGPGSGGGGPFSATIDGASWSSPSIYSAAQMNNSAIFTIAGSDGVPSNATGMSLSLYYIDAPGTYPLGVGGTVKGGIATLTQGVNSWWTPLSGNAGTVTVTSVSASRIAGTFSYSAVRLAGTGPLARSITNGTFDMAVGGNGSLTVPAHVWSRFGGTLAGDPWNAATVVMVGTPSSGTVAIGASNDEYIVNMIISGVTGTGQYNLNTGVSRQMTVSPLGVSQQWGGAGALSSGSVTFTSITSARVAGSYTATLQPSVNATGTVTLSGTFDVGIPQ